MRNKKGQAAALIGIITLLIIFYIIFLPPSEREKILEPEKVSENKTVSGETTVLLETAIGFLSAMHEKEIEHPIPNIVLEELSSAQVLLEVPPFTVKKGWLGEQKKTILLPIKNLANLKNAILTFSLTHHRGALKVTLNGVDIFEGTLTTPNPQPITLPLNILQEQNQLEVTAEGTGVWFLPRWYEFRDIKIIADVGTPEKREASHLIHISTIEKEHAERGTIRFFAICDETAVGTLSLLLNGKEVFSGTPDCGSIHQQEVLGSDFEKEKNLITFRLDKGRTRLEQVTLKNKLKEAQPFVQFFQLEKEQARAVNKKEKQTRLKVTFVDDRANKKAEVNINGQKFVVDQKTTVYEKDISRMVKQGNNFVSLTPITELKIVSLEVVLE